MSRTLTLAGDVNAADTRTVLTGQGSISAPSLVVPSGMHKIRKIYAGAAADFAAAGSCTYLLRLGGSGVLNGEQAIIIGGAGGQAAQSGSDVPGSNPRLFQLNDADIDVSPSDTISIAAEACGSDLGDNHVIVTLVFGR